MTRKTTATVRFKTMLCRDCGARMEVGSNTRKAPRCVECGVKATCDNNVQLASHDGPYFEKWLAACIASASRRSTTTPPLVE